MLKRVHNIIVFILLINFNISGQNWDSIANEFYSQEYETDNFKFDKRYKNAIVHNLECDIDIIVWEPPILVTHCCIPRLFFGTRSGKIIPVNNLADYNSLTESCNIKNLDAALGYFCSSKEFEDMYQFVSNIDTTVLKNTFLFNSFYKPYINGVIFGYQRSRNPSFLIENDKIIMFVSKKLDTYKITFWTDKEGRIKRRKIKFLYRRQY